MNTTARTAHADQLHATVRDARTNDGHAETCDALNPCQSCQGMTVEVRAARHAARVSAHREAIVKAPSMDMLHARLAHI